MGKLRVAVIMGGRSAEREVSLWTGEQVLKALDPERYEVICVDSAAFSIRARAAREQIQERVAATDPFSSSLMPVEDLLFGPDRPDVAFLCLHGQYGEDGTIQGLLDLLEIPYTGSGVLASALGLNKVMSKIVLRAHGIPTPEDVTITGAAEAEVFLASWKAGTDPVGLPAVVKPNEQGSTIGITIVRQRDAMAAALDTALAYGPTVLIERFVSGVEITAPIIGNDTLQALPLVEIVPTTGFFDYERKYTPGATEEIIPARLDPAVAAHAAEVAKRAHRALGCRGLSRVDIMVEGAQVWVLEVNTIPGMTANSLLPKAAAAAGISFPRLLDRLIELALERRSVECEVKTGHLAEGRGGECGVAG